MCGRKTVGDGYCSRECELLRQIQEFGSTCLDLRNDPNLPIAKRVGMGIGGGITDNDREKVRRQAHRMPGERVR